MNSSLEHATSFNKGGDICMLGGIYSDEKCPVCGNKLKDNKENGCVCPDHPQVYARTMSVRFKQTHQRFSNYEKAAQFLYHLRFDVKNYDPRD